MAEIASLTFIDGVPNFNVKMVYVVTGDTDGAGSTITVPNMTTINMVVATESNGITTEAVTFATNVITVTADNPNGVKILVVGN